MIKIMFVCHGNICRSPMAEFVMRDLINKSKTTDNFFISSSATSYEEIGNSVHRGTKSKLLEMCIPFSDRVAVRLKKSDYDEFDYFIGMDDSNVRNILRIFGSDSDNKVYKLLDFCDGGDISDPWYTGDFDRTFDDILKGCTALLDKLMGLL